MAQLYKLLLFCYLLIGSLAAQCQNPGTPVTEPGAILKNMNSFLQYMAGNLTELSENYIAYDVTNRVVGKVGFLKALASGSYIPLRLNAKDSKLYFKLYKLQGAKELKIGDMMAAYAVGFYKNAKYEGRKFPPFYFTDINGVKYSTQNTVGKIVILKCWFIGCQACEEEMPALNDLVKKYKDRKDIVFVSLAPDSKIKLQAFLKKRKFDYALVPDQNKFMTNNLKVTSYPTHFIINKKGIIVSVMNTAEGVEYALKNDI